MKAMILNAYGDSAAFQQSELPTPSLKPGHVLIQVAASSVNTFDTMIRSMGRDLPLSPDLPAVLGMDFAGVVEAAGDGVDGFARATKSMVAPVAWPICRARLPNTYSPMPD